ncbi:hypothetical protein RHMOL_Rhmol11G0053400 [Rhododendron molle]|uniref:Uncharacterized protein n=1 Tax=Rhododendron molle TaxID=49168 RepID=A0ACC0LP85_RHOML|nr:hypothetical protein RHMOL_Rhmol11G0053400 [Rhododendron molle]
MTRHGRGLLSIPGFPITGKPGRIAETQQRVLRTRVSWEASLRRKEAALPLVNTKVLETQSVATEASPSSLLAALQSGSPSLLQKATPPASPSSASSTSETQVMADQPLSLETMLMNLQNSITTMQQRAIQTDANITRLNDLINTRLLPPLEEEGEDDEDDQEQPVMFPDPNHEGRLIVQPNTRKARAPAANSNLTGRELIRNLDIAALMAKMAKLEESVTKSEKISIGGIDLDRLCLYPNAKLPDKFKMPDLVKFDGSGDPKTHLYGYHAAMKLLKVESEAMSQLFPQTLSGPAFHWFLSLDISKRKTWEDIGAAFIAQYNYNSQLKMTIRELESTKIEAKESFVDFVKRWRAKAALMTDRPSERDQLRIISHNLHLDYAKHLVLVQASANFKTFFESGLAIEDALPSGILPRGESSSSNPQKSKSKAYSGNSSALFGGSNYASTATSGDNAAASPNSTADINQVQNTQSYRA